MSTLLKPLAVRERLLEKGTRIFTPELFARLFATSPSITKYFLERQADEGLLVRLKRGLYTLKTDLPSEEEIANALYQPSYLSFEYALAYHGLLPEMPSAVTSATTKATRLFSLHGKPYYYRSIAPKAFTGYSLVKKIGRAFLLAEPEKAVADYFYFISLRRLPENDRLNERLKKVDRKMVLIYAALFGRPKLIDSLEKIL